MLSSVVVVVEAALVSVVVGADVVVIAVTEVANVSPVEVVEPAVPQAANERIEIASWRVRCSIRRG
jgi:hypothetical protein